MNTRQVAKALGYTRANAVTELIRLGRLVATKVPVVPGDAGYSRHGYKWYISKAEVAKFRKNNPKDFRRKPRI